MRNYIVYDKTSGEIIRCGRVSRDDHLEIQAIHPNEAVIEGVANDIDHRINPATGRIIPTPARRAAHDTALEAERQASTAKRQADIARITDILTNPSASPDLKALAKVTLERL